MLYIDIISIDETIHFQQIQEIQQMEKQLPTMSELENCFLEYISNLSGKFRRKRHSIGSIMPDMTDNEKLLLSHSLHTHAPPHSNELDLSQTLHPRTSRPSNELKSNSMHVISEAKQRNMTLLPTQPNTLYDFFCKNTSPNLQSIVGVSDNSYNNQTMDTEEAEEFDAMERIIPEYYINEHGIKVGTFNHNFYNSIIDSIRNMRVLTKFQLKYLEECTQEEYHAIVIEYNKVIEFLDNNHLF